MTIRTRFAPSPTGYLHLGSARTALFAYLYARRHGGQFILRVEDTDQERSTEESKQAILGGMDWLGLEYDGGPIYQSDRFDRYQAVADTLLASGQAYRCTCSKERLAELREQQTEQKQKPRYDGHCRDLNIDATSEPFVIRFRTPQTGEMSFTDLIRGDITVQNAELDDVVLVRADGVPTYNFTVVVDDADMQISHVIRGDDHINNTPRQLHIYQALGFTPPAFAHVPMILGPDGKRLSKRHGAVSVLQYEAEGYLSAALVNYLARLGWSHGDAEIISREQLFEWFDLANVSHASAHYDKEKLNWLNQQYLKQTPITELVSLLQTRLQAQGVDSGTGPDLAEIAVLLQDRAETLADMATEAALFYQVPATLTPEAEALITAESRTILAAVVTTLSDVSDWRLETVKPCLRQVAKAQGVKFGQVGQPLRAALTGTTHSPSIDAVVTLLGKAETINRLEAVIGS